MLKKIKPEQNHELIQHQETKEKTETDSLHSDELFDEESIEIYSQILANIIIQKIIENENR